MRTARLIATIFAALLLCACASPEADRRERAAVGQAMFDERCKKSGVFIHRTVKDVEGIFVMKIRPKTVNYGDQFTLDDPYGRDHGGDNYLASFLRGRYQAETQGSRFPPGSPPRRGYHFVEAVDPTDGARYRYAGRLEEPWQHDKRFLQGYIRYVMDKASSSAASAPRYGLTYDDISTREEREHWIAGSSLRVIDTHTSEVMAERIGYMWDPQQGNRSGGRSPWLLAANYACPSFYRIPGSRSDGRAFGEQGNQALDFVESVVVPRP